MDRRDLLSTLGVVGLSGCLRLQNSGSQGSDADSEQTQSPTVLATASPTRTSTPSTETEEPAGTTTERAESDEPTETASPTNDQPGEIKGAWTQYGLDAANSGYTANYSGPTDQVSEIFRVRTEAATSSSPIVADGRVFFTSAYESNELHARDLTTGEPIWVVGVEGVNGHHPAYKDGQLYISTNAGKVFGINADSGSFVWQAEVQEEVEGPTTVGQSNVYVTDVSGRIHAFSLADGSVEWRTDLDGLSLAGPAVQDDTIYVASMRPADPDSYPENTQTYHFFGGYLDEEPVRSLNDMESAAGSVYALSTADGSQQWRTDFDDFVVGTPSVGDQTVYIGCWDNHLYALSATDGSPNWRHDVNAPISGSASVDDDTVYVGTWDASLFAIGVDGSRQWLYPTSDGSKITSKPSVTDERVYAGVDDGPVIALTTDGRKDWSFSGPVGDFDQSSPAVVNGALYICGDTGWREVEGERQDYGGLYLLQ